MSSAAAIAASGLAAAGLRLDASARNVANALSDGYAPVRVEARAAAGGGVEAAVVPPAPSEGERRADAALSGALLSRVDLATEVTGQLSARRAFEANLAVLRAADEAERSLLDLLG
jgi:flagellar basal-body rod protein FlgC